MMGNSARRSLAIGTLVMFSLMVMFNGYGYGQSAVTPLTRAQDLLSQGKYDEAVSVIQGYINETKDKTDRKPDLAAAWYLLAKIYYEVGDDEKCDAALLAVYMAHPGFDQTEPNFGLRERVTKVKAALQAEAQRKQEEQKRAEALKRAEEQRRAEEQKKQEELKKSEVTQKVEDLKKAEEAARTEAKRILEEAQRLEKERKAFEEQLQPKDAAQSAKQKTTGQNPPAAENKIQGNQKYSESVRKAMEAFAEKKKRLETETAQNRAAVSRLAEEPASVIIAMVPIPGKSYAIGKYEVTQGNWRAVMGNNPSAFPKGNHYPVENVSWNDAQEFIRKLNGQTGKSYRLPTVAEWETACRAGTTDERYGYYIDAVAWYKDNSEGSTHPVGQKQPNDYGLYDTLGNVWEWCQDFYGPSGSARVVRGGSWFSMAQYVRSGFLRFYEPDFRCNHLGFRLALDN